LLGPDQSSVNKKKGRGRNAALSKKKKERVFQALVICWRRGRGGGKT